MYCGTLVGAPELPDTVPLAHSVLPVTVLQSASALGATPIARAVDAIAQTGTTQSKFTFTSDPFFQRVPGEANHGNRQHPGSTRQFKDLGLEWPLRFIPRHSRKRANSCGVDSRIEMYGGNRELMTPELAVAIADIRLLQTTRLLERLAEDHAGSDKISRALGAVSTARNLVTTLAVEKVS